MLCTPAHLGEEIGWLTVWRNGSVWESPCTRYQPCHAYPYETDHWMIDYDSFVQRKYRSWRRMMGLLYQQQRCTVPTSAYTTIWQNGWCLNPTLKWNVKASIISGGIPRCGAQLTTSTMTMIHSPRGNVRNGFALQTKGANENVGDWAGTKLRVEVLHMIRYACCLSTILVKIYCMQFSHSIFLPIGMPPTSLSIWEIVPIACFLSPSASRGVILHHRWRVSPFLPHYLSTSKSTFYARSANYNILNQ